MGGIVHYHASIPEGVSDKLGMYGNCALPQIAKQFIGSCVQLFSLQATIEVVVKSQSSMAFQELTRLFLCWHGSQLNLLKKMFTPLRITQSQDSEAVKIWLFYCKSIQ